MEETKNEATKVTGCKTCKQGLSKTQWGIVSMGMVIFVTSIYGIVQIVKDIISLF
jgi:hypothetical protein